MYDVLKGHANHPIVRDDIADGENSRTYQRCNEYIKIKDRGIKLELKLPFPQICKQENLVFDPFTQTKTWATYVRSTPDTVF